MVSEVERINEKGTMKINQNIFGRIAYDAVGLTEGKAFSASEKGKQLTGIGGTRPTPGEIGDHMIAREEEGRIYLELYIIMSFGASIQKATQQILDYMEGQLKILFPDQGGRILLKIVGVKSKQIAARDIEVERVWN